jgi:hypothetical protein
MPRSFDVEGVGSGTFLFGFTIRTRDGVPVPKPFGKLSPAFNSVSLLPLRTFIADPLPDCLHILSANC